MYYVFGFVLCCLCFGLWGRITRVHGLHDCHTAGSEGVSYRELSTPGGRRGRSVTTGVCKPYHSKVVSISLTPELKPQRLSLPFLPFL